VILPFHFKASVIEQWKGVMKSKRLSICRTAWGLLGSVALMMLIGPGTAWAEKITEQTNQKKY
jgi:hypothetical protein